MSDDAQISVVDDMVKVIKYCIISTLVIIVDEKVVHIGSVPGEDELKNWL